MTPALDPLNRFFTFGWIGLGEPNPLILVVVTTGNCQIFKKLSLPDLDPSPMFNPIGSSRRHSNWDFVS